MLQNPRKTLGYTKNMVYKIPLGGGGGEVNHIQPVAYVGKSVLLMRSCLLLILSHNEQTKSITSRTERQVPDYPSKYNGTFQMSLLLTCCTVEVYRTQMGQTDKRTSIFRRKYLRNSLFQKRSLFDFLGCFTNYFRR